VSQSGKTDSRSDKDIFFDALDISAADDRGAFLAQVCAGDPEKRRRLDELIANHFAQGGFMQASAAVELRESNAPLDDDSGKVIGPYKLLEKIGEGGFGVVYVAEQRAPVKRRVALKIIKLGMDTRQVVARFEAERQALAMMEHPNIAKVFDAGATETGRPYFVMELVRGVRITDYCRENNLPVEERLNLFAQVCHAIQHAHQKGIIHRDIKPPNVLITLHDGAPAPKVIDFGIAKAIEGDPAEHTVYTQFHQFVGTPAYMSPEQAEMSGLDVDTRTDIYALGVLLYELLTGHTPFESKELLQSGLEQMRKTIREKEPIRPSTRIRQTAASAKQPLAPRLSPVASDLDWIVMKCLEKDRTRRYPTANGLAADIQRHLSNEPVSARAPTASYKLQKFARRNRGAVLIISVIVVLLIGGTLFSTRQATIARRAQAEAVSAKEQEARERVRADDQKNLAERNFYLASMALAQIAAGRDQLAGVAQTLEDTASNPHRGFEWYYRFRTLNTHTRSLGGHAGDGVRVEWSPDGRRLVSAGYDGRIKLWDVSSGRELDGFAGHNARIHTLAYSPNGKLIATGSDDHTARVWDAETGKELLVLRHSGPVWHVTFSPNSRQVVSTAGGAVIWDAITGARVRELGLASRVAFSPDSTRVAKSGGRQIWIHDASSDERIGQDAGAPGWITTMAYSPDGTKIFAGYDDGAIQVVDGRTGKRLALLQGHSRNIISAVLTPDGRTLASSDGNSIVFWDASTYERKFAIKASAAIAFSPDGRQLVGSSAAGLRIWKADESSSGEPVRLQIGTLVFSAGFSGDAKHVLTSDGGLWDVEARKQLGLLNNGSPSSSSRYFPEFTWVATVAADGIARIWDTATRRELLRFGGHPKENLYTLAISPDGKRVFTASSAQAWAEAVNLTGKLWDAQSGEEILTIKGAGRWAAFFPDGNRLATGSDKGCHIWNLLTGQVERTLPGFGGAVAVSSDGRRIVTADSVRAQIWNLETGAPIASLQGHTAQINSVAFSHDGRRIVTGGDDDSVRLWDSETGKEVLTLTSGRGRISTVEFSADDQRLVAAAGDQVVIWEAASPDEVARLRRIK
jgi:WD40 repeat protein/serine/threonine protein kinase